ncbi:MAG: hypothetical protein WC008_01805 [Bacilli bacterium]
MKKNKKNKIPDEKEKKIQEAKEEIEKMLKDAEEQLGVDRKNVKVIKIKMPQRTFKYFISDFITTILLNVLLVLSLSGYLEWTNNANPLDLMLFALVYSGFDIILRNIINFFFPSLIIKTIGLINFIPPIFSIFLVTILTRIVVIKSVGRLIFLFMCLIIMRIVVKKVIANYRRA